MIKDLDDIAWFQEGPGVRNYQYTTNGTKLINVSNLGGVNLNLANTSRYISNEEANSKYKHFLCDAGDLVIASSGINETSISEKVSIVRNDDLPLCMNTSVIRFKPLNNDELSVKYLYYFFKSDSYKKQIMKLMTGIAQLNYGPSHLHRIKINYVEKAQQERITSQLDSLSSLVETQKKQLSLLDELIKSRFIEMFGDIVCNDKSWTTEAITKVCPIKQYDGKITECDGKVWLLNLDLVESNTGTVLDKYYVVKSEIGNSTITFSENNVLYSKLRPYLNKVIIPDGNGYATSELVPFYPLSQVNKYYLAYALRSDSFVTLINSKANGAKMPRAPMGFIRSFLLPLPPIELQNEFASFVGQVDKSKFVVQERIKLYQELLDKKMDEYFN